MDLIFDQTYPVSEYSFSVIIWHFEIFKTVVDNSSKIPSLRYRGNQYKPRTLKLPVDFS